MKKEQVGPKSEGSQGGGQGLQGIIGVGWLDSDSTTESWPR